MKGRARTMVLLAVSIAPPLGAQEWNSDRTLTLVRQATDLRARQLADTALVDYQATAHGYLTFLAQLGEGFREPPRIVKADELALEVYWRAPNLSKQRIMGRRDTLLLPTDIEYHRDHLGIVQNNFPAIIRLGDGDEVRDVPHPLSPAGLPEYDFALADSLRISIPGRTISVFEVKVRPKNDRLPRVIGALYLDRDNAQVVRLALSFTRAAFLDKQLEDLFIVLENGLVGTRFWLPRRQEIEIRRTATWLDYPVRGIIRGRWEIGDYEINTGLTVAHFTGPEIVFAPVDVRRQYVWPSTPILDSLPPDVRAVTADEIRRIQAETRALVRAEALRRTRTSALAARGMSDFVRFNRVEGLALGGGMSAQLGAGWGIMGRARYGFDDRAAKGKVELRWQSAAGHGVRAYYLNDFRDVSIVPERSLLVNSIAAQELASDYLNPYGIEAFGLGLDATVAAMQWSLDGAVERQFPLMLHATPAHGAFRAPPEIARGRGWRATLAGEQPTRLVPFGLELRGRIEGSVFSRAPLETASCVQWCDRTRSMRLTGVMDMERPMAATRLVTRTIGGLTWASGALLTQDLAYLGGPISAPGYAFHALTGRGAISQRIEVQIPVPFVGFSLGRFGRSPARATLAPFANGALLQQVGAEQVLFGVPAPWNVGEPQRPRDSGFHPSLGVGLLTFFDLLRFDAARGLRDGRWTFSVDVGRAFWSVL